MDSVTKDHIVRTQKDAQMTTAEFRRILNKTGHHDGVQSYLNNPNAKLHKYYPSSKKSFQECSLNSFQRHPL